MPTPPPGLTGLVRAHVLDSDLASLLWILLEGRTPVIIAGEAGSGRTTVADALAGCLPPAAVLLPVSAADRLAWLPEAATLGWTADLGDHAEPAAPRADRTTGVLLVRDLADEAAGGPAGDRARVLVRAVAVGYGMLATMPGRGLEDVLERLHAPEIGTVEDERSRLGLVLVMASPEEQRGPRVAATHYLRPVALDTHGHVQRLPPVVLATWTEAGDRWDQFAWGVLPDLAGLVGTTPRELEAEQARRAAALRTAAG
jgi:hypothetical protein